MFGYSFSPFIYHKIDLQNISLEKTKSQTLKQSVITENKDGVVQIQVI